MDKYNFPQGNADNRNEGPLISSSSTPAMQAMIEFLKILERTDIQHEIKEHITKLLHTSIKYEQETSELIRLVPTEGLMSYGAKMLMTTVMNERYLHAPPENHAKAIRYPDIGRLQEVYDICREALKSCLKADFVNIDPLAGLQAMQFALMAYTKAGELILGMSPEVGGHESTSKIADSIGRQVEYLPFDYDNHIIDVNKLDQSKNPSLVYVDHSNILRPHDLLKIKQTYPNAILCFDISQVFASAAGGIFPNPLQQGADVIVGSTHKSLNGPQKAIMATNNKNYDDRFSQISGHFISNNHPGDVVALAMTLLEFQVYGKDYANQMVNNANALAMELSNQNLPVYGIPAEGQYTYSSHVWIDCEKAGHSAEEITKKLYEDRGIVVNTLFLPKGGIHSQGAKGLCLGTTEVTRIGMKEKHMLIIAKLIASAFTGAPNAEYNRSIAHDLRCKFPAIEYSLPFSSSLKKTEMVNYKFTLPEKTPAIAIFGPSGSGKNTLIKHLMSTGKYVQVPIITTRPARGIEPDRKIVSSEMFRVGLKEGKIVYASEHYGHWHGVEKDVFEELANSGKRLILDPNQFPRLDMLREIFAQGGLNAIAILPDTVEGIKLMSNEEIELIYRPRIQSRSGVSEEEVQMRVQEGIETLRSYCERFDEFEMSFINTPSQDPSDHFGDFDRLVENAFNDNVNVKELRVSADFPKEIKQVLHFFSECSLNYAIFAGFASHLLADVPTSLDVDILVESSDDCLMISRIFQEEYGWILTKEKRGPYGRLNLVLGKEGSELDLVFSPHAVDCFLKENYVMTKSICDVSVKVLGPEAMLLTKIAQITSPERSTSKMSRDSLVINRLRSMSDIDKLRNLVSTVGQEYWLEGTY